MVCEALFNAPCFLFGFLPVAVLGYWLLPAGRPRLAWLVGAGCVFYAFWDVRFVPLLLGGAVVDFLLAHRIAASRRRRAWLATSVVFNLGVLFVFKYAGFAVDSTRSAAALLGHPVELPAVDLVLPIGISFFTFKAMSYTIEVYRGRIAPSRDLLRYVAFIMLFPDLVAGPLVRFTDIDDQLADPRARPRSDDVTQGVSRFVVGLFKKVAIADVVATGIAPLWVASDPTAPQAWLAAAGFAVQLYFDFSGYSDMAIGIARMLGMRFPENFDQPYRAANPSDFWRRWHMTLSTWLRDYLYIPLGGSRRGGGRIAVNLMVVMLLGGLWHGAAWTFVAWGAYHGALLVAYRAVRPAWDAAPAALQRGATLGLVVVGWVFFRAPDLATAGRLLTTMFAGPWTAAGLELWVVAIVAGALAVVGTVPSSISRRLVARPRPVVIATLFVASILFIRTVASPFLYYQF